MKKIFTLVLVIILVAASVYLGYSEIKNDQSAEDSGAYAVSLNNVCEQGEVPILTERVVLNSTNTEKIYTLTEGKYFIKIGGEGYEKAVAEEFNHFITFKVNANNKKTKVGAYFSFSDSGPGSGSNQYWLNDDESKTFVIKEEWSNKTVNVSIGKISDGAFGEIDNTKYPDYEYYIGTCTKGTTSTDLGEYVMCENGEPTLVLEKKLDLVPESDSWQEMTLEPAEYALVVKEGAYWGSKNQNTGVIAWAGGVMVSLPQGNKYYAMDESYYTSKSTALAKSKGQSTIFKIDTASLARFSVLSALYDDFEKPLTNENSGNVMFGVYKCDGGVVYTPPTCTSFTYGEWKACVDGVKEREILTSTPTSCTGGNPVLTEACTATGETMCTSFNYGEWGACTNGTKTRVVTESFPSGCTGGSPMLSEACSANIGEKVTCPSLDSNSDNNISLVDLSSFLSYYGKQCTNDATKDYGACGSIDANNDSDVGLSDLSNLLAKYDQSCN